METATKTKRTLLRSECLTPPREIRDNTKVRRQWLADKLAEVSALPNREAKIVGTGSYQSLSVYEVKEVAGRLRLRGSCQFCGHSQVVDSKVLVLHGYNRPGDGMLIGRCPGVGLRPLNQDKSHTEKWLADAVVALETADAQLAVAERAEDLAAEAFRASVEADEAYKSKPRKIASWMKPTQEQDIAYRAAYQEWAAKFPLCAAYSKAQHEHQAARQHQSMCRSGRDHFQYLIDSETHGTELTREVVA